MAHGIPGRTLRADLLVQVDHAEIVHVEYETRAEPGIARRMLEYRGRIVNLHPDRRLRQYVLVLGDGTVDSCDDPVTGFRLGLNTIYLRDRDPARFLTHAATAPLAVLAAGDTVTRKQSLVAAMRLIRAQGGPRTAELLQNAERLAAIRLDPPTIEAARKESGMSEVAAVADFYEQMDVGQELLRRGRAEGEAHGRAEGEAEVLAALLRSRFGDHPDIPAVAGRLAAWPDPAAAVHAVTSATALGDLLGATAAGR